MSWSSIGNFKYMPQLGVAKNTTYFTLALVLQKTLSFIYFYFLSNGISQEPFGRYVFALSYASLFSIFIDLGMTSILIRESSRNPDKANDYLKNIISVKFILSIITIAILVFFIHVSGKPAQVRNLVYLASIIMLFDTFTMSFWGIFRSQQNMFYESTATIFVQIIIFIFGFSALYFTHNIIFIMMALVLASIFNFSYSIFLLKIKLHYSLAPIFNVSVIKHFLILMPAFALSGIFIKIYNASDSVLLGFLSSDTAVGFYAVPTKTITSLAQIIPSAFAAAVFPVFSYYYKNSSENLKKTFLASFSYLIMISIPLTGGLILLIPKILKTIWKPYIGVAETFIIMSFAIPFIFLAFATGYFLLACDRQKNNTFHRGIQAGLSLLMNFLLIPSYSYLGSGITFLIVNIVVFALDMIIVQRALKLKFSDISNILTKSLFACIIMLGIAYILLQYIHFILVIIISAIIYFTLIFIFKAMQLADIKNYFHYARK